MTSQRGNGRGPPEGLEQRVVGQVLGNATGGTKSPCHLADPWIERVHNDADLWEPIPKDPRDRRSEAGVPKWGPCALRCSDEISVGDANKTQSPPSPQPRAAVERARP